MAFDPKKLPSKVYEAYKLGVMAWPLTIQEALESDILDLNKLTDIVFYLHHPELVGRSLAANDTALIRKWKLYRGLIASRQAEYKQRAASLFAARNAMPYDGSTGGHYGGKPYDPADHPPGSSGSGPDHPSQGIMPVN
jgi:hypothetical protein